jgi:Fur family transcriptional regulator, ferric uptake regulator
MSDNDSIDDLNLQDARLERADRSARHGRTQQAIANLVKDLPKGTHLTAPEVYRHARTAGLQVSLSTVYRALNNLQADGNVTTLGSDRGRRYESANAAEDHDHLICLKCGLTIEFVDELIRGFGKSVAQRKGFEHKSSRFDILGLCSDCKARDEDHQIEHAVSALEHAIEACEEAAGMCKQAIASCEARKLARGQEQLGVAVQHLKGALANCEELFTILSGNTGQLP